MAKKAKAAPQRAVTSKAFLIRRMREIRSSDPEGYQALLVLIRRLVDKKST